MTPTPLPRQRRQPPCSPGVGGAVLGVLPIARTVHATPATGGATAHELAHAVARKFASAGDRPGVAAEPSALVTPVLETGVF